MQENLATLRRRGVHVLRPEAGRLAGGDVGAGRLADPRTDRGSRARSCSTRPRPSARRSPVLVTAGGTREPIDPVRYVGNRSSGKMGHAIANVAARRGARVVLVTTAPMPSAPDVEVVRVETAEQMHDAVLARVRRTPMSS